MYAAKRAIALLLTLLSVSSAQADIPGQNDPVLTDAIARWLAEDDPTDALREIGDLAADGHVAAQVFANTVFGLSWTFPSEFENAQSRLALFPPADGDDRPRRFRPYQIDHTHIPVFAARSVAASATSADEFAAALAAMAQGGRTTEAYQFLVAGFSQFGNQPVLFEALVPYANGSQRRVVEIWGSMHLGILSTSGAFPDGVPEQFLEDSGFFEALEAGQWTALWSAALLAGPENSDLAPWLADPRVADVRAVWPAWPDSVATDAAIAQVGRLIAADPAPYHQPLRRICASACGVDQLSCITAGTIELLSRSRVLGQFEPIVSAEQFFASPRADQELRLELGHRLDLDHAHRLPHCLLDAAIAP